MISIWFVFPFQGVNDFGVYEYYYLFEFSEVGKTMDCQLEGCSRNAGFLFYFRLAVQLPFINFFQCLVALICVLFDVLKQPRYLLYYNRRMLNIHYKCIRLWYRGFHWIGNWRFVLFKTSYILYFCEVFEFNMCFKLRRY